MDNPARKKRKAARPSDDKLHVVASPQPSTNMGFFGAPPQAPVQITLDQTAILLISSLIHELKTQNDINLFKLKLMAEQQKSEIESEEKMQQEDTERFEELRHTMYS